jgi:hypothetical protein
MAMSSAEVAIVVNIKNPLKLGLSSYKVFSRLRKSNPETDDQEE